MHRTAMFLLFLLVWAPAIVWGSSTQQVRTIDVTLEEGTNMAAALSPDAQTIAIDLQGTIWTVPIAGGTARPVTDRYGDAREPAWSPDGRRIAFQSYRDGNWHIWTVTIDGRELSQLTFGPFDDREPHWSHDGGRIAFSSDRGGTYDLWQFEVETGELRQLTDDSGHEFMPAWSPDDGTIAFVSQHDDSTEIATLGASGARQSVAKVDGNAAAPSWSRDGTRLLFNTITELDSRLFLVDARGDSEPQMVSSPGEDVFPFRADWLSAREFLYTADGKVKRRSVGSEQSELVEFRASVTLTRDSYQRRRRNFDSTDPNTVIGIVAPAVSPDGQRVAFTALGDLWVLPIGGDPQRLTEDQSLEVYPAWSPDGSRLVFTSDRAGTMDLWIRDMTTTEEWRLTDIPSTETTPSWSPDGTRVAFMEGRGSLKVVDVASKEITDLHEALFNPGRPTWSRDGHTVAVSALTPYSSRFREGVNEILLISTAGEADRRVTPFPHRSIGARDTGGPVWSPDGSMLAFASDGALWVVHVNSDGEPIGPPRRIANDLAESISWAGDSRSLVFQSADKLKRAFLDDGRLEVIPVNLTWQRRQPAGRLVVHAGQLFDGSSESLQQNVDIVVEGNRIREIVPHTAAQHSGRVVDASRSTVMPGLVDMHTHQGSGFGEAVGRIWLSYGITTVREPASNPYEARERLEAIESGVRIGPREFYTGGTFDGSRTYYPGSLAMDAGAQVEAELERAEKLQYDMIKTYVRLADPVQQRVVERAHELGLPVSSHEIYPAVAYGVDGVEHIRGTSRRGYSPKVTNVYNSYQDVVQLLARSGMTITPTLGIFDFLVAWARDPSVLDDPRFQTLYPSWVQQSTRSRIDSARNDLPAREERLLRRGRTVKAIVDAGGRVVAGTDSPILPYALSLHAELELFVGAGLTPFQALQAATVNSARLLGAADDLGAIQPGMLADIVVVDGNPLNDIRDTKRVRLVIKNGEVYEMEDLLGRETS